MLVGAKADDGDDNDMAKLVTVLQMMLELKHEDNVVLEEDLAAEKVKQVGPPVNSFPTRTHPPLQRRRSLAHRSCTPAHRAPWLPSALPAG